MHPWVTRTTASVVSLIAASGTFSTRTSPAAYMTVARILVFSLSRCWLELLASVGRGSVGGEQHGHHDDQAQPQDDGATLQRAGHLGCRRVGTARDRDQHRKPQRH